jgi:hypothetical protein
MTNVRAVLVWAALLTGCATSRSQDNFVVRYAADFDRTRPARFSIFGVFHDGLPDTRRIKYRTRRRRNAVVVVSFRARSLAKMLTRGPGEFAVASV